MTRIVSTTTIYENKSGSLKFIQNDAGLNILLVQFCDCERIPKDDGMIMLSAMRAFYGMNKEHKFAHLFDLKPTYVPSPDLIMATIELMREMHVYFQTHLKFTGVVAGDHADALKRYMRSWVPTKPVHYLHDLDEIHDIKNE